jgi:vacuolar protein-sorting-associated protein 4
MQLWDVPPDKLKVPVVTAKDFERVMRHSCSTVSEEELQRFIDWTKKFGQDGA